jgi:type II secretory pathway predicted ATPase ExeA
MKNINDFISHFGFHSIPFTREIECSDHFLNNAYEDILMQFHRVVDRRMSAALIAPAGCGKTSLLRSLHKQLPQVRYRVHYVKVCDLSKRDLCREISRAVGIEHAGNYPTLVRRLQEYYRNNIDVDGVRPILILDDAHDMRTDVLALVRILTNFNMDSRLVLSMIISGQGPLKTMLEKRENVDVAKRLAHFAQLAALSRTETFKYIRHRCLVAGSQNCPIDDSAMEVIFELGQGNMRATDHLALKAIEIAHDNECNKVNSNHVQEASTSLCK